MQDVDWEWCFGRTTVRADDQLEPLEAVDFKARVVQLVHDLPPVDVRCQLLDGVDEVLDLPR